MPTTATTAANAATGGVFPSQWIRAAIADGIIAGAPPVEQGQVQPNSLDVRLGGVCHRLQCSFLPGKEGVAGKLSRFRWFETPLTEDGIVLGQNQAFLFPLCESLNLPPDVYARANPKSTTGRLDVFTRLVTEYGTTFDEVPAGYHGPLYLEVVPRSFAIRVRPGDTLAQLRFQTGDPRLSDAETAALLDSDDILFGPDRRPLRAKDVPVSSGLIFSIGLSRKLGPVTGYVARKNTAPIDLRGIGKSRENHYWDRIIAGDVPVILEPDEFYIFRSREFVRLPPNYCAEMVAFDAGSGEVRTHYAGFFDSGFGYSTDTREDRGGASAAVVLEVRSRDVPFLLEDGQPLFHVQMLRSIEEPDLLYGKTAGSNYQGQGLRLPKQFGAPVSGSSPQGDAGKAGAPPAAQITLDV